MTQSEPEDSMDAEVPKTVEYDAVRRIVEEMINRRAQLDFDTRERELNAEGKIKQDYAGRVLFELFQNAVDRAEARVRILADEPAGRLYFGNDGKPVSVYDFESGQKRSDLHSLCSLNTSNKEANNAIGNKGVGFRSVFAATNRVRVWSKAPDLSSTDGRWWGIELRRPFPGKPFPAMGIAAELVNSIRNSLLEKPEEAPSFYFPAFLEDWDDSIPPDEWLSGLKTVVVLEDLHGKNLAKYTTGGWDVVRKALEDFQRTPLWFVGEKYPSKKGLIVSSRLGINGEEYIQRIEPPEGWTKIERKVKEASVEAEKLDIRLDEPSVAVLIPPPGLEIGPDREPLNERSLLYGYLPTEETCGFSLMIHGDFALDTSRRHVDLEHGRATYNRVLLEAAIDALYAALIGAQGVSHPLIHREDAWRFLDPRSANRHVSRMVFERIIRNDDRWQTLCRTAFNRSDRAPYRWYADFWRSVAGWWDLIGIKTRDNPYSDYNSGLQHLEERLLRWMRESLPCWPLVSADLRNHLDDEQTRKEAVAEKVDAIPLPDPQTGRRSTSVVFYRRPRESGKASGIGLIPTCIRNTGTKVAVSWFLPDLWDPTRLPVTQFDTERVLKQVDSALSVRSEKLTKADCEELLLFAWDLVHDSSLSSGIAELPQGIESNAGKRWTSISGKDSERRLGAYAGLARVPVPIHQMDRGDHAYPDGWAAAGECSRERDSGNLSISLVDRDGLRKILEKRSFPAEDSDPSDPVDSFLRWLGTWAGPSLVDRGGKPSLSIEPGQLDAEGQATLANVLSRNWNEYREAFSLGDVPFRKQLLEQEWFPIDKIARARPMDIWLVDFKDQRKARFLSLLKTRPDGRALFDAGFLRDLQIVKFDDDVPVDKILNQLRKLRELEPDPGIMDARSLLVEFRPLYRDMVDALRKHEWGWKAEDVPLLYECIDPSSNRTKLRWVDIVQPNGSLYYVNQQEYQRWKRYFPQIPFFIGESGKVASSMGFKQFSPVARPKGDEEVDTASIKAMLAPHMSLLLAVAESARVGGGAFNLERVVRENWNNLVVRWGRDVYLDLVLEGQEAKNPPGLGRSGDVYPAPRTGKSSDQELIIYHDLHREELSRSVDTRHAPRFSEALASLVFGNAALKPHFESALRLSCDPNGKDEMDRWLDDMGSSREHVEELGRQFESMALDESKSKEARRILADVLGRFGELKEPDDLPLYEVRPDFFSTIHDRDADQAKVTEACAHALADFSLIPLARFMESNLKRWREWVAQNGDLVLQWIFLKSGESAKEWDRESVGLFKSPWQSHEPTESRLFRLGFDPEEEAGVFLKTHGYPVPTGTVVEAFHDIPERDLERAKSILNGLPFADPVPVVGRVASMTHVKEAGMHTTKVREGVSREKEQQQQHERGFNAELSFSLLSARRLEQYLYDTGDLTIWDDIRTELERVCAVPSQWPEDPRRQSRSALANILHVARPGTGVDGAGYDVLDIEPEKGCLLRTEVKSSKAATGPVTIHLSEAERRWAGEYLGDSAGISGSSRRTEYRLVCYQGMDKCWDLTNSVREVIEDSQCGKAIDVLNCIMPPESYRIVIETGAV